MLRLPLPSHPWSTHALFRGHTLRPTPWHEGQTCSVQPPVKEVQCQYVHQPTRGHSGYRRLDSNSSFLAKKTCFVLHFLKDGTLHFHFLCEYSKLDRVKPMGTPGRINAIWWNIKINSTKTGSCVQIWIANKYAEFHTKKPNPSENTVKSFKGATLFWITLYVYVHSNHKHNQQSYKHKPCKWS